jgi:L-threonylcarbamoyladenylate synthase
MIEEIQHCVEVLKQGKTLLYPTDTIWGLGCDATNADAIEQIIQLKQRPKEKHFIILLEHVDQLYKYVKEIPYMAYELIEFADRPLTIVYEGAFNLPEKLIHENGTIGIRITKDPFCAEIIRKLKKPLLSTSANISGKPSPIHFKDVDEEIRSKVDYVAKYRQEETFEHKPSQIIELKLNGEIKIIRA